MIASLVPRARSQRIGMVAPTLVGEMGAGAGGRDRFSKRVIIHGRGNLPAIFVKFGRERLQPAVGDGVLQAAHQILSLIHI